MAPEFGFFRRVALAFSAFFKVLFDVRFAGAVAGLSSGARPELPPAAPPVAPPPGEPPEVAERRGALRLLGLLQREGRLVDFVSEDVAGFGDADVGIAARVVHEGCRKALRECLTLEAIHAEAEGATIVLQRGFDANTVRLTGNVVGDPPFRGSLRHHGWRAVRVDLPRASGALDPAIVAPAEVELP